MTITERPAWQGRVRGSPELIRQLSANINSALGDTSIRTVELDTPEPAAVEPPVPVEPATLGIPAELADIVVERALVSILSVGVAGLIAGIGIGAFFALRVAWMALRVTLIVGASIFGARVIAKQLALLPAGPGVAATSRRIWRYTRYVVR